MPVFEQPNVEHGEDAADIAWAFFIEIHGAFRGVEVERCRAGAFPIEKLHRHESIKEIADAPGVQPEFGSE